MIGWIGDAFGARWTIGIGPLALAITLLLVAIFLWWRENVRVSFTASSRPHLQFSTRAVTRPVPEPAR